MKVFIETTTPRQTRKYAKEARELGNIVAVVAGGLMIFDSRKEYSDWRKQK